MSSGVVAVRARRGARRFDEAHQEIAPDKSQGEFVTLLIDDYKKTHQKVQV